jgi:hypothetical protein
MNIMKNTVLKSFIMLGFFFGITSCSEKDEQPESHEAKLPEITFEGRQFIACYVNEEPFVSVPQGGIGMNSKPDAAIYSDSILYIRGTGNEQMRRANIGLAMIYNEGQRLYPLNFKYANYRTRFTDNSLSVVSSSAFSKVNPTKWKFCTKMTTSLPGPSISPR